MQTLQPALSLSLKNILLATDFSQGSEVALRCAQALSCRHGSRVHTIHVSGPDSYQLLGPDAFALTFNGPVGDSSNPTELIHELLNGLPTEVPVHAGEVWEVISDVVRRNEIDLLVLASHGRHGIQRVLLGSVAENVFRNVSCPVLTIGPDVKSCDTRELRLKKILLATHRSPQSDAPQYAGLLSNEFNAELTVLQVLDDHHPSQPVLSKEELMGQIGLGLPESNPLWRTPDFLVDFGVPAEKILQVAQAQQVDLIVLGARHPEPAKINSHLPWATAARVIAEAPCPVLTVRQRDEHGF